MIHRCINFLNNLNTTKGFFCLRHLSNLVLIQLCIKTHKILGHEEGFILAGAAAALICGPGAAWHECCVQKTSRRNCLS